MPAQISIGKIVEKSLEGIAQAQKDYEAWTGGDWLWNAPEYMLSTYIAQMLSRIQGPKYVTLEESAKSALDDAGAIGRGKLNLKLRVKGRFDILLWWGRGIPRAVIEVKNQISGIGSIETDLQRIAEVLKRKSPKSSFQFGLMTYYTSSRDNKEFSAKERVAKLIENIYCDTKTLLKDNFNISSFNKRIEVDKDSAWVAAALLIKYKNT